MDKIGVTNGAVDPDHYGPIGDAARGIASYCDDPQRVHVYTAAFDAIKDILATRTDATPVAWITDFQAETDQWMDTCFGSTIKSDTLERDDRFIEECLELVQTNPAFTADRAHALIDYVFGRPVGEPFQETGGVMVTLAARSNAAGISIKGAAETELTRIWTKVEAIRAKQATKPTGSALPIAVTHPPATDVAALVDHFRRMIEACANYVEPTTYIARHPIGEQCKWGTEFPEPDKHQSIDAALARTHRRDKAFIMDMIYMLDGPEQRAALAPFTKGQNDE